MICTVDLPSAAWPVLGERRGDATQENQAQIGFPFMGGLTLLPSYYPCQKTTVVDHEICGGIVICVADVAEAARPRLL